MSKHDIHQTGNTHEENFMLASAESISVAEEFRIAVELVVGRHTQMKGKSDAAFVDVVEVLVKDAFMGTRNGILSILNNPEEMKNLSPEIVAWANKRLKDLNEFLLPSV